MRFCCVLGAFALLQLICFCNGHGPKKPKPVELLGQARIENKMDIAKMYGYKKSHGKPLVSDAKKSERINLERIEADLLIQEIIAQGRKNVVKDSDAKKAKELAFKNRKNKLTSQKQFLENAMIQKHDGETGLAQASAAWPEGTYAFPKPAEGCPSQFSSGCRYEDTEDWDNLNTFINDDRLQGFFSDNIEICYCVRTTSVSSGRATWPAGRYCINRYGGSCPAGFTDGELFFDDEDDGNQNTADTILPDGTFDSDTRLHYCCRSDGSVSSAISMPTSDSFILYQYLGEVCQSVDGMSAVRVKVKFDNEDNLNKDECNGGPYNPLCDSENHEIHMCYYS